MSVKTAYERGCIAGFTETCTKLGLDIDPVDAGLGLGGIGALGLEWLAMRASNAGTDLSTATDHNNLLMRDQKTNLTEAEKYLEGARKQQSQGQKAFADARRALEHTPDSKELRRQHARLKAQLGNDTYSVRKIKEYIKNVNSKFGPLAEEQASARQRAGAMGRFSHDKGLNKVIKGLGRGAKYLGGGALLGLAGKKLYDVASD